MTSDSPNGYFIHQPGRLSKGAVLDVGLKCTHSCKFCYYSFLDRSDNQFSGMRHARFRTLDECREILRLLKERGFINFDITGGEPTLHPDIIEICRYAHQDLGLKGRMITLGQFLMRKMKHCKHGTLIDDLLESGLVNFLFSLHAVDEKLFRKISGESYEALHNAMCHLDEKAFQYTCNTTVFEWNYKHLPDIAREVTKHAVYLHNFIIMNAYYEWNHDGRAFGVQAEYSKIHPYLKEAVEILESEHVGVNIRYAPLCAVKGMEKNLVGMVGVRYDPYEWMNQAGHHGGAPDLCASPIPIREGEIEKQLAYRDVEQQFENGVKITGARTNIKYFSESCVNCKAKSVCDGIDPNYLKLYGADEFIPYETTERAPLQKARRQYRVPFIVKTGQDADMKAVVSQEFERADREDVQADSAGPKVSVIIPCYNYARYLEDCVTSVVAQTFQDLEIVIVNDGSTDETEAVAENLIGQFPEHAIRLISQVNSGQPAVARNRGIAEAGGDYILCLDADDRIGPTMLQECVRLLQTDDSIAIAYTDRLDFDGVSDIVHAGEYDFERLRHANHLSYCALFRKEVWDAVGGYRMNVKGVEDWDFWVAAGSRGFYGRRIPKPLFEYRRHDTGIYQQVLKDFQKKSAQIVLNNIEAYTGKEIARAKEVLQAGSGRKAPLVSIIIPTCGRPHLLKQAIRSVLDQTFADFELVIVNDGGPDIEKDISEMIRERNCIYVRLVRNGGRSHARNTGLHVASGKYITYLDDDDVMYPDHLQTLVAALENHPHKVVYADAVYAVQTPKNGAYETVKHEGIQTFEFSQDLLLVRNIAPIQCFMHEKECLADTGEFDETLHTHEDWDLWIRLSQQFDFLHVPKVTSEYRFRTDQSNTSTRFLPDFLRTMTLIHQRYRDCVGSREIIAAQERERGKLGENVQQYKTNSRVQSTQRDSQIAALFRTGQALIEKGKLQDGLRYLSKILQSDPHHAGTLLLLGDVYAKLGKPDDAKKIWQQGVQIHRDNLPLQQRLGHDISCSIIIPVFNNLKFTKRCLEMLCKSTPAGCYEIIVVDNHSSDGTAEFLALASDISVVSNTENLGFARACNQGAEAARHEFIVFLNNDVEVQEGWLETLVMTAWRDASVGAVGSKLLRADGKIQHAGVITVDDRRWDLPVSPSHIYYLEKEDLPQANVAREYAAVTAACMLTRKSLFLRYGPFDEAFENGFEDVDYCYKLREAGHRIIYRPESVALHYESQTRGQQTAQDEANLKLLTSRWQDKIEIDVIRTDEKDEIITEFKDYEEGVAN